MNINLHRKIELVSKIIDAITCIPILNDLIYAGSRIERQFAIMISIAVSEASDVENLLESIPTILLILLPESDAEEMRNLALKTVREVLCQTTP